MSSEGISRTVTLLLNDALEALESGDWNTARARAATVLALDPSNEQAQRVAALALQGRMGRIGAGDLGAGSTVLDPHRLGHAVARIAELTTFPAIALRIISPLDGIPMTATSLAQLIATESTLSAAILRVANSAYYEHPTATSSVPEVIALHGSREVEALALTVPITRSMPSGTVVPRHDFWRFSLCVATLAGLLAEASGVPAAPAFAAGLLHDIGLLALDVYAPQELRVAVALQRYDARSLHDRERQVFGFTDADLGAALARRWLLPGHIVGAIERHGDAEPTDELASWIVRARTYVRCAGVSDGVERSDGGTPAAEWSRPPLSKALDALGGLPGILRRADQLLAATG